ncbi:MAG TPA: NAD(P)/FAD-dependent oxidoreductase [Firmicutes bacterium]|nr:NAD(P)/FAD-dependent oxidoreductase [Bacillota bacterium]
MDNRTDILIVGAGPAGLSAAVNAAARGKAVRVLSGEHTILARAEAVDNYLGLYHLSGPELMRRFEEHAAAMGIVPEKGRVSNILPFNGSFMANFSGRIVEAGAVILATGAAKARPVPGEAELLGRGVSYCATCDGMLYRGKRAVVWGLAPDAPEEANFLHSIGVEVTYVARGERPEVLAGEIPFLSGRIEAVEETGGRVSGARVSRPEDAAAESGPPVEGGRLLPADAVFILRAAIAPAALIDGLAMEDGFVRVNRQMETNIPGLFAAGDCTGAPLQIANAVGDGLVAAQQAARYLDRQAKGGE